MVQIKNFYGVVLFETQADNLEGADLRGADLISANLEGANLEGADLISANLRGANLRGANLPNFSHIPEEGSFIAYKKLQNGVVAKLSIPENAKRTSSLVGRKNRAEFVIVLALFTSDDSTFDGVGLSSHDNGKTKYEIGQTVYPDSYDDDIREECKPGIHFFITRKEAEEY